MGILCLAFARTCSGSSSTMFGWRTTRSPRTLLPTTPSQPLKNMRTSCHEDQRIFEWVILPPATVAGLEHPMVTYIESGMFSSLYCWHASLSDWNSQDSEANMLFVFWELLARAGTYGSCKFCIWPGFRRTTYLKSIMHSMDAGGFNLMETTLSLPKLLQQSVTAVFWGPGICSIKQNVSKLF